MKRSATANEAGADRQVRMYPSCVGLDCVSAPADTSVRLNELFSEGALASERRRATGGPNRQQNAADQDLQTERASCIVETRRARCCQRVSARADDARRAGAAVLRCAEVAEEVVVLELAGEQEECVERYADERPAIYRPASHLLDDITGR